MQAPRHSPEQARPVSDRALAQARLASIVESSDDAIIAKDLNSIITDWNRGAELMFGYAAAEMIGTSILRLIPPGRRDEETGVLRRIRLEGALQPHHRFDTVRIGSKRPTADPGHDRRA